MNDKAQERNEHNIETLEKKKRRVRDKLNKCCDRDKIDEIDLILSN